MSFITNIIFVISGCIELVLLIICIEMLGVNLKDRTNLRKLTLSLISFIGISVLVLIFRYSFNNTIAVFALILYIFRFILSIFILYGHLNLMIVYLVIFGDLSLFLINTSTSSILANIIGTSSDNVSYYTMISIMTVALIIVLHIRKKCIPQRNAAVLLTIPNYIYIMLIITIILLSSMPSLINYRTDSTIKKRKYVDRNCRNSYSDFYLHNSVINFECFSQTAFYGRFANDAGASGSANRSL